MQNIPQVFYNDILEWENLHYLICMSDMLQFCSISNSTFHIWKFYGTCTVSWGIWKSSLFLKIKSMFNFPCLGILSTCKALWFFFVDQFIMSLLLILIFAQVCFKQPISSHAEWDFTGVEYARPWHDDWKCTSNWKKSLPLRLGGYQRPLDPLTVTFIMLPPAMASQWHIEDF